jgi:hypothetical protein
MWAKAASQVLAMAGMEGAAGKMTTLTVLEGPQDPVPAVPAGVDPQFAARTHTVPGQYDNRVMQYLEKLQRLLHQYCIAH